MLSQIDEYTAKGIATRFFEQLHPEVSIENTCLDGSVWKITVITDAKDKKTRLVEINAKSGKILSYA